MTLDQIREAVAQGWCSPANSHKEMDSDLAIDIADAVFAAQAQAAVEPVPDDIVEPLYDAIALAAAHQAGRKSVHDSCVDLWKDEFLAAARVAAINECANECDRTASDYKGMFAEDESLYIAATDCAKEIRALIGANDGL